MIIFFYLFIERRIDTFVSKSQTPEKEVPQLLTNSVSDQKTNESRLDLASSSQMVEDDSDTLNSQDTVILINQEHHTISSSGISSMSYSDDSLPKSTLCEIDSQFSDNHNEGPVLEETSSDGGHSKVDLLVKENLESDLLQFSKKMGVEACGGDYNSSISASQGSDITEAEDYSLTVTEYVSWVQDLIQDYKRVGFQFPENRRMQEKKVKFCIKYPLNTFL